MSRRGSAWWGLVALGLLAAGCESSGSGADGCRTNGDCPSGVCISGRCWGGDDDVPAECDADGDCASGTICVGGRCVGAGGCTADPECTAEAGGRCVAGTCRYDDTGCRIDTECPGSTCDTATGLCRPAGCQGDVDCPGSTCDTATGACRPVSGCAGGCDDENPCTTDACVDDACVHTVLEGCCADDTECDDGDVCTFDSCDTNVCHSVRTDPACCSSDAVCDDSDATTVDRCGGDDHHCVHLLRCTVDGECADDDPCTTEACVDGGCERTRARDCCTREEDCNDADACTIDRCNAGTCTHATAPGCCERNEDCDDGDVCTSDRCEAGGNCVATAIAGCCRSAADCDDADPCTDDACDASTCRHVAVHACCVSAAECDDDDACTDDTCDASACRHTPRAGCCGSDRDCDDGIGRTADTCTPEGTCTHEVRTTCASDAECDDANPCTLETCVSSACEYEPSVADACRCTSDRDCAGKGGVCSLLDSGASGILPFCVPPLGEAGAGTACDPAVQGVCRSGLCLTVNGQSVCYGACTTDAECAAGSECDSVRIGGEDGTPETTIPMCTPRPIDCVDDAGCPSDMVCLPFVEDENPGRVVYGCLPDDGLRRTGATCTAHTECASGYCIPDTARGGVCFGLCDATADCQAGQRCYPALLSMTLDMNTPETTDDRPVDLPSCQWDDGSLLPCELESDCAPDETCFPFLDESDSDFAPICRLPLDGGIEPGQPCTNEDTCGSAQCVTINGATWGLCLLFCDSSGDCPTASGTCGEVTFSLDSAPSAEWSAWVCVEE